jgi:hypothetical protein
MVLNLLSMFSKTYNRGRHSGSLGSSSQYPTRGRMGRSYWSGIISSWGIIEVVDVLEVLEVIECGSIVIRE